MLIKLRSPDLAQSKTCFIYLFIYYNPVSSGFRAERLMFEKPTHQPLAINYVMTDYHDKHQNMIKLDLYWYYIPNILP